MELWNLIRCEFIKHFSWKKNIIVFIILIISGILLVKIQGFFGTTRIYSDELSIENFNTSYEQAKKIYNEKPTIINEGILESFNKIEESYKNAYNLVEKDEKDNWQKRAIESLQLNIVHQVALEKIINNYENDEIKTFLDNYTQEIYSSDYYSNYKGTFVSTLQNYYDKSIKEINDDIKEISIQNDLIIKALEENSYYLMVRAFCLEDDVRLEGISDEYYNARIKYCEYFNNNEIKSDEDYRSINATQYVQFSNSKNWYKIPTEQDYNSGNVDKNILPTYESAINYYQRMSKYIINQKAIIDYAFNNELKHDVIMISDNVEEKYNSSKTYMNLGLHFGVIIMVVMAITNAGIVSKEHDKGTIKLLLTKPVSRSKVLLSKYIYLILDTYIWWIIASLIMFFLAGFKCGFSDLFSSKIIAVNGVAKEVNYLLWYFKELLICSIPVCCLLSILFSFSTITLSTPLTASITSIVSIFSITIWALIANFNATFLTFLSYTPLPYLDYWFIRYHNMYFVQTISRTSLSDNYGLIISIIVTIILLLTTMLIYNKRDIKN